MVDFIGPNKISKVIDRMNNTDNQQEFEKSTILLLSFIHSYLKTDDSLNLKEALDASLSMKKYLSEGHAKQDAYALSVFEILMVLSCIGNLMKN